MPIDSEPKLTMEDAIREEMSIFQKKHVVNGDEREVQREYLNNFVHKIPGKDGISTGDFPVFIPEPNDLEAKLNKRRNSRPFNFDENDKEEMEEILKEGYSTKFIFQIYQQFIDDINTAIESSGINRTALTEFIAEVRARKTPFDPIDAKKEKELVFPIFVKLREMGYSLQDLRE